MVAAYVQALRGSHRNVRLLLTNSALMGFAIDGGIYSVIFNLYLLRLNFGPEFVGQVNSVANLVFAIGSLTAGVVGYALGRTSHHDCRLDGDDDRQLCRTDHRKRTGWLAGHVDHG